MKPLIALLLLLLPSLLSAESVLIMGSSIVQPPVADAVKTLRNEKGMEIEFSVGPGVSGGLAALAAGTTKLVMMAREIEPDDRANYPNVQFQQVKLARQVAALCVASDVWNSGIHQLTAEQVRGIYEGRITNWKELGGLDEKIVFFHWEEGLGMWELMATWLYGNISRAPKGKFTPVESNEEARNSVEFTKGAMGVMSPKVASPGWAYPLALVIDGQSIPPTVKNIASGAYSLSRPLVMVSDDRPTGEAKKIVDYLLSPAGQECFAKKGFFTMIELGEN